MPTMFEIYRRHAQEYDELVSCEDYEGNLSSTLHRLYDFSGKRVVEFGTGTGRVTALYIAKARAAVCCDRSTHMLERAKTNLSGYGEKIEFREAENFHIAESLSGIRADAVIEGWSFGHTVSENRLDMEGTVAALVSGCLGITGGNGPVIFIESLGTNVEQPMPPTPDLIRFFMLLEEKYGFKKEVVATPYRFESVREAERIMGFFFGEEMGKAVANRGDCIIPEFTGIWYT